MEEAIEQVGDCLIEFYSLLFKFIDSFLSLLEAKTYRVL